MLLIGRAHLALPFAAGIAAWSIPIVVLGLAPGLAAALLLIAAAGTGRVVMDVAGRTLLQRVAPERTLTRVFGVLEGMQMASLALGSVLAPAMIVVAGTSGAFALAGGGVLFMLAILWRPLSRVDRAGVARPREIALLRGVPVFAPLGPMALEQLAVRLVPIHAHEGSVIIRQGEPGEHFYIVVQGSVEVDVDGRPVRTERAGESFGEIALLRDVPRTATVRALESTELLSLERAAFLEAITGQPGSRSAAEETIRERLRPQEEPDASA